MVKADARRDAGTQERSQKPVCRVAYPATKKKYDDSRMEMNITGLHHFHSAIPPIQDFIHIATCFENLTSRGISQSVAWLPGIVLLILYEIFLILKAYMNGQTNRHRILY